MSFLSFLFQRITHSGNVGTDSVQESTQEAAQERVQEAAPDEHQESVREVPQDDSRESAQEIPAPPITKAPASRQRSDSGKSQHYGPTHSSVRFSVPTEEECWPVTMLLDMYSELRFERWLPSRLRTITKATTSSIHDERLLRGPNKRALCLWCSNETKEDGILFCTPSSAGRPSANPAASGSAAASDVRLGQGCEHEHRIRRDGHYVRQQLLLRDQGVCAKCGTDAHELFARASACRSLPQRKALAKQLARQTPEWGKKIRKPLTSMDHGFTEGMFWEAAHTIDIKHGGGLCGLEGFRTLCVPCHSDEYMRNYAEEVRNLHILRSPPAPNASTTFERPNSTDNRSGSAYSPSESEPLPDNADLDNYSNSSEGAANNGTAANPSSQAQARAQNTPTRQRPHQNFRNLDSFFNTKKARTNRRDPVQRPAQRIDLVVDLTSPSGKPIVFSPGEDLEVLSGRLTTVNISSDEQSSDDLEMYGDH
ncbi:hypothetical protein IWW48_002563 [Coemansia sp. RSA 1200]|nr:hypothetical protein IWW48_002563 [Coemansia sp. RSA 1200]